MEIGSPRTQATALLQRETARAVDDTALVHAGKVHQDQQKVQNEYLRGSDKSNSRSLTSSLQEKNGARAESQRFVDWVTMQTTSDNRAAPAPSFYYGMALQFYKLHLSSCT